MEAGEFAAELKRLLREDMNRLADHIALGGCQDYANYMREVGKIEALAMLERHLEDLKDKVQIDED